MQNNRNRIEQVDVESKNKEKVQKFLKNCTQQSEGGNQPTNMRPKTKYVCQKVENAVATDNRNNIEAKP